jgi:hypothetical protein
MQPVDQFANLLGIAACNPRGDQRFDLALGPRHGPRAQGDRASPKTLVNPQVERGPSITAAAQDFRSSEEGIEHLGTSLLVQNFSLQAFA